jgi:hypothetical protein
MPKKLILSIEDISIAIAFFNNDGYERLAEGGDTEYSIFGTPADTGNMYEPKHIWNVGCFMTSEELAQLQRVFSRSDELRRQLGNYRITLEDNVQEFIEASRTRAMATGGQVLDYSGIVAYPAKFYVRMLNPKTKIIGGYKKYSVQFTLKELDKFPNLENL